MWATAMGLYIQALSIRLGLATGWHLARVMRDEYPTPARYSLWILTELAIIASDVPEVIGTALALKLIFGLPTVWGVLVTSASTLLFLALQGRILQGCRPRVLCAHLVSTAHMSTRRWN